VKSAFRKLTLKYHPDKCGKGNKKQSEEMFKKVKRAKDIIEAYCLNYRIPFTEKEVRKNAAERDETEYSERFYDGWF
ncbi:MAG: DnaJ domain-containing protein, partial [Candidatus Aureabacteria bacterium]|nr:DnaJ domain-containing protein [Candidatus Auribacterota bacterium]